MRKLEIGKQYKTRCFGDHELVECWTITKRTDKTITAVSDTNEIKTRKIRIIDEAECANMTDGFGLIRA